MPTTHHAGQTFQKRVFDMDDCFFIDCILRDCDVYYSGGDAQWQNVQFDNCRWHFRGPALRTIQLAQLLGLMQPPQGSPRVPASNLNVN